MIIAQSPLDSLSKSFGCRRRACNDKGQVSIKVAVLIGHVGRMTLGAYITDSWIPGPLMLQRYFTLVKGHFGASRWDSTAAGEALLLVVAEALVLLQMLLRPSLFVCMLLRRRVVYGTVRRS
jgi:hypothetical protein